MYSIWTIAMKDLRLLVRDKGGLFFALVFPFLMAIFFGTIFSGGGGGGGSSKIPIALVDEDRTPGSMAFAQTLQGASELALLTEMRSADGAPAPLTREQATDLVRRGKQTAYVVIPKGYGDENASLFIGQSRELELGIDPSRAAAAGMLEGLLTKYAFEELGKTFQEPARMRSEVARNMKIVGEDKDLDPARRMLLQGMFGSIDSLMADMQQSSESGAEGDSQFNGFNPATIKKVEVAPQTKQKRNAYAWTFPQGLMWGVAGCAATFGISLVSERSKGTLVRLRTAPLSWAQILAGKGLACLLAILFVGTLLLTTARIVFGVVPTSIPLLAIGLITTALCFVGVMMLLSVLGRTEASAAGIGWALILVMMMVGGAAVPIEVMPEWMRQAAGLSPVKWGILAIEGGLWRNYSWSEMLLPCAILLGVGALTGVAGVIMFRRLESTS